MVAAASDPAKMRLATQLGAGLAVEYTATDWAGQVRRAVGAVDVVFDGVGRQTGLAAFGLLRDGGRRCSYWMASGQFARISDDEAASRGISLLRGVPVSQGRMRELAAAALEAAAAGTLRPVIGQTFPLADAAAAHEAIETRATTGKTLLIVSSAA